MVPEQREKKRLYNKQWRLNNIKFKEHQKEYNKEYYIVNRERELEKNKQWRFNNPEKVIRNSRKSNLKKFGLTVEQYNKILNEQGDCCAICRIHFSKFKNNFAVDHDHITKKIRGLLCSHCNLAFGHFMESIQLLEQALVYFKLDGNQIFIKNNHGTNK